MARKRQDVTDAELAVLQVLWDRGQATIRQVVDLLYPGGSVSEYATVKTLLARLEEKGYVSRDNQDLAHVFRAATSRDDLVDQRLQAVADNLCGGSRVPLLMNLLRSERLSADERKELRRFLDKLSRSGPKRT